MPADETKQQLTIAVFNESSKWVLPETYADQISEAAGDSVSVVRVTSRAELSKALPETDYLIGLPPIEDLSVLRQGRIKWIQLTSSIGDFDAIIAPAIDSGIRVSTAASIRAPQVAEHAMALLLALTRRLHAAWNAQEHQRWDPDQIAQTVRDLSGATAGVVAMGTIGQEIAQRLKAFGMHVIATRKDPANPYMFVDEILSPDHLSELMARSDAVVVAAPRTPVTEGLIGKSMLGHMKPSALLIDVSRGGVVTQSALINALRKQKIAGAALDAFEVEPLPPNSALWGIPNVIITPHVASASPRYWQNATEVVCRNLTRLRENRPLIDEVTPEWYRTPAQR